MIAIWHYCHLLILCSFFGKFGSNVLFARRRKNANIEFLHYDIITIIKDKIFSRSQTILHAENSFGHMFLLESYLVATYLEGDQQHLETFSLETFQSLWTIRNTSEFEISYLMRGVNKDIREGVQNKKNTNVL